MGASVARLKDARLSMIRFTHSICTAVNGLSCNAEEKYINLVKFQSQMNH